MAVKMKDLVSIEKVLNSRCSNENASPQRSHFGTFTDKHPPEETINHILSCCDVPRFSDGKLLHWFKNGYLFLGFENPKDPNAQRLLHVESGMQHEAVYLGCTAEGVGTCIHNQDINGTQYEEKMATGRHLIMEIADPYETGKFSTKAPGPQKPFVPGKNLTEPRRDGDIECITQLPKLTTSSKSGSSATEKDVSQLLWAAGGRTPHCVKIYRWNLMWGLTIPTWGGSQDYTSVYLVMGKKLYAYVNWTKEFSLVNRAFREKFRWTRGNPTHDTRFVRNVEIGSQTFEHEKAIVLCQNENTGRALWEVGYMLENMFLQAKSLGTSYESKIFSAEEISRLSEKGVANAVAAVFI
jgi:hypothetical protein